MAQHKETQINFIFALFVLENVLPDQPKLEGFSLFHTLETINAFKKCAFCISVDLQC